MVYASPAAAHSSTGCPVCDSREQQVSVEEQSILKTYPGSEFSATCTDKAATTYKIVCQ